MLPRPRNHYGKAVTASRPDPGPIYYHVKAPDECYGYPIADVWSAESLTLTCRRLKLLIPIYPCIFLPSNPPESHHSSSFPLFIFFYVYYWASGHFLSPNSPCRRTVDVSEPPAKVLYPGMIYENGLMFPILGTLPYYPPPSRLLHEIFGTLSLLSLRFPRKRFFLPSFFLVVGALCDFLRWLTGSCVAGFQADFPFF